LELEVIRHGETQPVVVSMTPRAGIKRDIDLPLLGVDISSTAKFAKDTPTMEGNPAALADPPIQGGDKIVELNGDVISSSYDLRQSLARNFDKPATMVLERTRSQDGKEVERITTVVDTNPRRELGLIMKWESVASIQENSPAAEAGFEEGDVILSIDGQKRGDLLTLDQRMAKIARDNPHQVEFVVRRGDDKITIPVQPRFPITRVVEEVLPNSAAESVDIEPGDELVEFQFLLSEEQKNDELFSTIEQEPMDLVKDMTGWAEIDQTMQQLAIGSKFDLTFKRENTLKTHELASTKSNEYFLLTRGILLTTLQDNYRSDSWSEAFVLGAKQTWSDAGRVWRFLEKLVRGKISPKNLGGPGTIALAATSEATAGTSRLLLFLTLLSANLAIVNFLPIPILDGGHMVMLAYEGIFRRPVTEQVQIILAYAGLAMLLALMAFVMLMDAKRIFELF
jgi:regulator of sigma E protease